MRFILTLGLFFCLIGSVSGANIGAESVCDTVVQDKKVKLPRWSYSMSGGVCFNVGGDRGPEQWRPPSVHGEFNLRLSYRFWKWLGVYGDVMIWGPYASDPGQDPDGVNFDYYGCFDLMRFGAGIGLMADFRKGKFIFSPRVGYGTAQIQMGEYESEICAEYEDGIAKPDDGQRKWIFERDIVPKYVNVGFSIERVVNFTFGYFVDVNYKIPLNRSRHALYLEDNDVPVCLWKSHSWVNEISVCIGIKTRF